MKREDIHIRDPFVFVKGNKYYLLGTTGEEQWEKGSDLTLYISSDLVSFEKKCVMVKGRALDTYTNIWAPELHEYNGKYYLIVSAYREDIGRGSLIFVSDGLDDKFQMLTGEYITPAGWGCLDATLFVYHKKPYLCFSNEWMTPITKDGDGALYVAELSADLTKLAQKPYKIISGKNCGIAVESVYEQYRGYVAEGPWMYEEGGKICVLWSTFTKTGYSVVKSVSENGIFGEYNIEKIVFDKDGGHCMRFIDLDGKAQIVLHQPNTYPLERMQLFEETAK